jgi:CspA family cold shock protein
MLSRLRQSALQLHVGQSAGNLSWEAAMPQGKVKKLVSDRGFGFVTGDDKDLFFHHSEVFGVSFEDLKEGEEVEYELSRGPKGPCAAKVRPLRQPA